MLNEVSSMVSFKQSKVDGAWICECGVAVYPTPDNMNEHIRECQKSLIINISPDKTKEEIVKVIELGLSRIGIILQKF